jgi:hypothetical protein
MTSKSNSHVSVFVLSKPFIDQLFNHASHLIFFVYDSVTESRRLWLSHQNLVDFYLRTDGCGERGLFKPNVLYSQSQISIIRKRCYPTACKL